MAPQPYAWRPVSVVAGTLGLFLCWSAPRWEYTGDELYFLSAGRNHPSWGYADQPPMLPMLARLMHQLFGDSALGFRLPSILVVLGGVFVCAAIAWEMGGRARAQTLSALTWATCSLFVTAGHMMATSTVDPVGWAAVAWLVVRWARTRADGLLLLAALVTAVDLQVKFLIPVWWLAIAAGALAFGPRRLLTRPLLWLGAGLVVLVTLPTLIWQARRGWPQFEVAGSIATMYPYGGRLDLIPVTLLFAGLAGSLLLVFGVWALLRDTQLAPYRFMGGAVLATTAFFLIVGGQPYYLEGTFAVCWAAGVVRLQHRRDSLAAQGKSPRWSWVAWPVYAAAAAMCVVVSVTSTAEPGRPQAAYVARTYSGLPPSIRQHTAIITDTHGLAGALDYYGPVRAYSGAQGYWYFGAPPPSATNALYIGSHGGTLLGRYFEHVTRIGTVPDTGSIDPGDAGKPIWLATGIRVAWNQAWPALRKMDLPT